MTIRWSCRGRAPALGGLLWLGCGGSSGSPSTPSSDASTLDAAGSRDATPDGGGTETGGGSVTDSSVDANSVEAGTNQDAATPSEGGMRDGGADGEVPACATSSECLDGQVCVVYGCATTPCVAASARCAANPCDAGALSCTCAAPLCNGGGLCSAEPGAGTVHCNTGG